MNRQLIEEEIGTQFKKDIKEIFQDNLVFAFICGGFAKGYWDNNHDIDTFICVKKPIDQQTAQNYIDWYKRIHNQYGFPPDLDYPGEIIEINELANKIQIIKNFKLELLVTDLNIKEAILWTDMIAGAKTAIIGNDLKLLMKLEKQSQLYPEKWKHEVLNKLSDKEILEWKEKSYLLIMEKFMHYPKTDAREFYKKYNILY